MTATLPAATAIAGSRISHLRRRATCTIVSKEYCLPGITRSLLGCDDRDPRGDPDGNRLPRHVVQHRKASRVAWQFVEIEGVLRKYPELAGEGVVELRGSVRGSEAAEAGFKPELADAAGRVQHQLGAPRQQTGDRRAGRVGEQRLAEAGDELRGAVGAEPELPRPLERRRQRDLAIQPVVTADVLSAQDRRLRVERQRRAAR